MDSSGLLHEAHHPSQPEDGPSSSTRFHPYATTLHRVSKGRYITSNDPRGYIPVYEYPLNGQWIMMDVDDGYILWTAIWKALGNAKADIVKMLESQPELAPKLRRVRGGYLKIQGTWMSYEVALQLARRVAWPIRDDLIPLFGPNFPVTCLAPGQPGYGQVVESSGSSGRRGRRANNFSVSASASSSAKPSQASSSTTAQQKKQPQFNVRGGSSTSLVPRGNPDPTPDHESGRYDRRQVLPMAMQPQSQAPLPLLTTSLRPGAGNSPGMSHGMHTSAPSRHQSPPPRTVHHQSHVTADRNFPPTSPSSPYPHQARSTDYYRYQQQGIPRPSTAHDIKPSARQYGDRESQAFSDLSRQQSSYYHNPAKNESMSSYPAGPSESTSGIRHLESGSKKLSIATNVSGGGNASPARISPMDAEYERDWAAQQRRYAPYSQSNPHSRPLSSRSPARSNSPETRRASHTRHMLSIPVGAGTMTPESGTGLRRATPPINLPPLGVPPTNLSSSAQYHHASGRSSAHFSHDVDDTTGIRLPPLVTPGSTAGNVRSVVDVTAIESFRRGSNNSGAGGVSGAENSSRPGVYSLPSISNMDEAQDNLSLTSRAEARAVLRRLTAKDRDDEREQPESEKPHLSQQRYKFGHVKTDEGGDLGGHGDRLELEYDDGGESMPPPTTEQLWKRRRSLSAPPGHSDYRHYHPSSSWIPGPKRSPSPGPSSQRASTSASHQRRLTDLDSALMHQYTRRPSTDTGDPRGTIPALDSGLKPEREMTSSLQLQPSMTTTTSSLEERPFDEAKPMKRSSFSTSLESRELIGSSASLPAVTSSNRSPIESAVGRRTTSPSGLGVSSSSHIRKSESPEGHLDQPEGDSGRKLSSTRHPKPQHEGADTPGPPF